MLHARYWKYDGETPQVPNTLKYDRHGFGIHVIQTLDAMIDLNINQYQGVSHQVHVAATSEQWEAAKQYRESGAFD